MDVQYLFTYGTLCRNFNNPFSRTLTSNGSFIGNGWFSGRLFEIDRFPGALHQNAGYRIQGEIYRLEDDITVLPLLDKYEECGPGFAEPTEYIRACIPITAMDNGTLYCWTYLYNWSVTEYEEIPGGNYFTFYSSRYGKS